MQKVEQIDDSKKKGKTQYPWLKLWCKALDNPKIQMLEERDQRRLIFLWVLRRQNQIAFRLRISSEELARTKKILLAQGLITEDWDVPNWLVYQSQSSSAARVRRFRERQKAEKLKTKKKVPDTPKSADYWPDPKTIEAWRKTYPLVEVDKRLAYIRQYLKTSKEGIKNKSPAGIKAYLAKALQKEQKQKEDKLDEKTMRLLSEEFKAIKDLESLHDCLLEKMIFSGLPAIHAEYVAKMRGIADFTIPDQIPVYRRIIQRARKEKNFTLLEAEKIATEKGFKLHQRIQKIVSQYDEEKKRNSWRPLH